MDLSETVNGRASLEVLCLKIKRSLTFALPSSALRVPCHMQLVPGPYSRYTLPSIWHIRLQHGKGFSEAFKSNHIIFMKLLIEHISKSYGNLTVLNDLSLTLEQDPCYCLMTPSGSGKTTLLRILMGLEHADSGTISTKGEAVWPLTVSAVFQEDRLCPSFSPLENVQLALKEKWPAKKLASAMEALLPAECLNRPVSTLSGGMKRRTAILRALLSPSDMLVMDEPFTGLDEGLKAEVIRYILEQRRRRFLLITTHQEEDVALLGGTLIGLK